MGSASARVRIGKQALSEDHATFRPCPPSSGREKYFTVYEFHLIIRWCGNNYLLAGRYISINSWDFPVCMNCECLLRGREPSHRLAGTQKSRLCVVSTPT